MLIGVGVALGGSLLLSVAIVELFRRLAIQVGAVDSPDRVRKFQAVPIPRLGGAAVAIALSAAIIAACVVTDFSGLLAMSVLAPALAAAMLGLWDDFSPISPWFRLALESGVGLWVWMGGTQIGLTQFAPLDMLLTIVWVVAVINAINMTDNMDGLSSAVTGLASFGCLIVAVHYGQFLVAALAASLFGSSLGFLFHNWHPARIYLGDAGAYFFGALLAILSIRIRPTDLDRPTAALVPLLVLCLPLADMVFVVVRRLYEQRHPFTPGRDHLSHVILAETGDVRATVLRLLSLQLAGVTVAVIVVW